MLKWMLHYISLTESKWKIIIDGFFGRVGGIRYILNCKCKKVDITIWFKKLKMPQYYKETIYTWFYLKEKNEGNSVFNFQMLYFNLQAIKEKKIASLTSSSYII